MTKHRLRLNGDWITTTFGLAIVLLATAHAVMQSVRFYLGNPDAYGMVQLFDLGQEANLPTFFSCLQLLVICLLLSVIGLAKRQAHDSFARHWLVLALIFLLLAADEMSEVHEMSIRPIRELAPWLVTGFFYWAWVIPPAVLVLVVALSYVRFVFLYLPRATRNSTVLGALLFVGGAIGVEMPEARYAEAYGMENFTYSMFVLLEETLEMTGVLVFLSGLVKYFSKEVGSVALEVLPGALPAAFPAAQARSPDTRLAAL